MISSDYFSYAGKAYVIVVDRYSGWLSVHRAGCNGAKDLITILKDYFATFAIARQITSDGGPQYTSHSMKTFLKEWNVSHRVSSSYFPHANLRAELGVKSAKRMIRNNI